MTSVAWFVYVSKCLEEPGTWAEFSRDCVVRGFGLRGCEAVPVCLKASLPSIEPALAFCSAFFVCWERCKLNCSTVTEKSLLSSLVLLELASTKLGVSGLFSRGPPDGCSGA